LHLPLQCIDPAATRWSVTSSVSYEDPRSSIQKATQGAGLSPPNLRKDRDYLARGLPRKSSMIEGGCHADSGPVRRKDADAVGAKGQDVVGLVATRVAMLHAG
jgi:hypothetical protein